MRFALLLLASLALAACGSGGRPASGPRVTLKLSAPDDSGTVRAESVQVHGTVSPGDASVLVNGETTRVQSGAFTAEVALAPGANVIDVAASAPGHRTEADAVRVTRDMRVELPDLTGAPEDEAMTKLTDLGMRPRTEDGGSFLDRIIPGPLQVCQMKPDAGSLVDKGTKVTIVVARQC